MRVKKDKSKVSYKSGPLDNQKWENFARYIASGETQANAAKLAGFKEANAHIRGCILMKKDEIRLRVEELQRVSSERAVMGLSVSKAWVLQNLKTVVERAMQAVPVTDAQGNEVGQYKFDGSAANRALELIGKEIRMFVERKIIGLRDLRGASADELFDVLAEIDSALEERQQAGRGEVQALPPGEQTSTEEAAVALVEAE